MIDPLTDMRKMSVSLVKIEQDSRYILENLFVYYIYDMSEFMGWSPDQQGQYTFNHESLTPYWQERDHIPYFIHVDNELAGFALIRHYPANPAVFDIEQFFVLRKFKGNGVGKKALSLVVGKHPGTWQIRVLKENKAALKFWEAALTAIVGAKFEITLDIDIDLQMHFLRFDSPLISH
ncbi:GNAT family N-acetyltransferase [Celerinatantimonas yamalensis]|uniref:GNAT family N-acetyltransferase n=1 Tax=Celerinatantimonas yamalensis TaxID=559956 RepID=A0ABW9G9S2_9GAMM